YIIISTTVPHLAIAPARISLAKLEALLVAEIDGPYRLKDRLDAMKGTPSDFVIIDTAPALGLLPGHAVVAAKRRLSPVQSSYFALEGTDDLLETVEKIRARPNPNLKLLGAVI